jgi:hypothetical protein
MKPTSDDSWDLGCAVQCNMAGNRCQERSKREFLSCEIARVWRKFVIKARLTGTGRRRTQSAPPCDRHKKRLWPCGSEPSAPFLPFRKGKKKNKKKRAKAAREQMPVCPRPPLDVFVSWELRLRGGKPAWTPLKNLGCEPASARKCIAPHVPVLTCVE